MYKRQDNFQEKSTAHTSHTWKELKGKHHILTSSAINETASVDYYRFTGYDANGNPQFAATPFLRIERSLSDIGSGDSIQTALSLQPIPPVGTEGTAYGVKAVITITDPVCVDYKWAGRWTPDFNPPDHEPVSYTHLDVYKRQPDLSAFLCHGAAASRSPLA